MTLQKVNLFSLAHPPHANSLARSHLLIQGYPTGRKIKGRQVVDQYSSGQRYVLITDDDNPYEEVLHIYLLDLELRVVDEIHLSQPFTSGIYQAQHHSGERLEFRVFNDDTWCLEIRSTPVSKPLNIDHFPASRPIKLWGQQYLNLMRTESVA